MNSVTFVPSPDRLHDPAEPPEPAGRPAADAAAAGRHGQPPAAGPGPVAAHPPHHPAAHTHELAEPSRTGPGRIPWEQGYVGRCSQFTLKVTLQVVDI